MRCLAGKRPISFLVLLWRSIISSIPKHPKKIGGIGLALHDLFIPNIPYEQEVALLSAGAAFLLLVTRLRPCPLCRDAAVDNGHGTWTKNGWISICLAYWDMILLFLLIFVGDRAADGRAEFAAGSDSRWS